MSRARDISNFSLQDSRLSNVDSDYIEPLLTPIHISGDVAMIGRTSSSSATAGAQFSADGNNIVRDGQSALTIKRLTSDGDIATFAKDGSTVGTIFNGGGNLGVNSAGGLLLVNDIITPTSGDDNTHDLGRPSARWNNLYLSGGVFVGGTGPGNKLEDYEEGTRSSSSVNGITASTNTVTGHYTKIGRQVVEHIKVVISGKSGGSGNPWISLSFTPSATVGTSVKQGGSIGMNTVIASSTFLNTGYMGTYGGNPSVYANDYQQGYYSSGNWGNGTLVFTVIYEAD
tara:strand:+ start:423 stop:1277 length:855 start_codon:yes stop_codon:yes gene_type:complete